MLGSAARRERKIGTRPSAWACACLTPESRRSAGSRRSAIGPSRGGAATAAHAASAIVAGRRRRGAARAATSPSSA